MNKIVNPVIDATKAQVQLMFQNSSSPISEKCSKIWHLMLKDRLGSHLIAKLYLFFITSKNCEDIKSNLDCFCIFSNDVEWIVGGLGRIAFSEQLTGRQMLPFFKVIHKFHSTLEQYRRHHIEIIQVRRFTYLFFDVYVSLFKHTLLRTSLGA